MSKTSFCCGQVRWLALRLTVTITVDIIFKCHHEMHQNINRINLQVLNHMDYVEKALFNRI